MRDTKSLKPARFVGAAVIAAMLLQGCDESLQMTAAAQDPGDACAVYHEKITAARQTDMEAQAQAAIAGALIGAVLGAAMAGGDSNDRARGAMIGAMGGGLAGFSGAYYQQKAQRAADASALLQSVNTDAGGERALITRTGQSVAALRQCRAAQVADLTSRVKKGKTDAAQARTELAYIKRRVQVDNGLVSAAFNGIGKRVNAYVDVTAQAAQADRAMVAQGRAATRTSSNVAGAVRDQSSRASADAQATSRIDNQIRALEALLG